MDKETRTAIERATQRARKLLEDDFASQLEGTFDVLPTGDIAANPGAHLTPRENLQRDKIVAAIERKRAAGLGKTDAVADYLREAAFTTLNRFVALKTLEARALVQECVSKGDQSAGYREYHGLAPDIALLPNGAGYRLYIESLFDELSTAVKVLFDRRDVASVLWPKHTTFETLLGILNATDLAAIWNQDETIGWVYQFFNSSEERRKMRDESQAPRNSRELAVRNQFFTPRYVVEFLVDNTLGRTWLEMHGQRSSLNERCRYFVRSTDESPPTRPKKDPRDLRILDPACGSGHFLLYCFDLLLVIYEEAWLDPEPVPSKLTGDTLREKYPELTGLAAFRRKVPILIVEHNLYGVDIDPRAAQIAAFALWLRAQRAFKELNIPAGDRDPVSRTHIVVAEPMPGDAHRVEEFASRLNPPLVGQLFRKMVHEMRLAGELGSLLRVETATSVDVALAQREFEESYAAWQATFPGFEPPKIKGDYNLMGIEHEQFFEQAEDQLHAELEKFAESATGGESTRRKLFVGDATYGIALIELLRKRFDVVLMNPPFGAASLAAKQEFERTYPRTKNDIYAAFVERGVQLLRSRGLLGAITSRTGFFLSSFQKWREGVLLKEAPPIVFADLGYGVMDAAMVEAAAYCLEKDRCHNLTTVFLRVLEAMDKASALMATIEHSELPRGRRFKVESKSFASVPGSPFAYWVSDAVRALFAELPPFEAEGRTAKCGAGTLDDFRFLRLAWEPRQVSGRWVPFAKGGSFGRFYSDIYLLVSWAKNGEELKCFVENKVGSATRKIQAQSWYFRPGLTWPRRTNGLSLRAMPAGSIFADKGPAVFVEDDDADTLLSLACVTNSRAFALLISLQLARTELAQSYEVGLIQKTPFPHLGNREREIFIRLARQAWSLRRSLDLCNETSHAFTLPALLLIGGTDLETRAMTWAKHAGATEAKIAVIQTEIDERCFKLYGIAETDRRAVTEGIGDSHSEIDEVRENDGSGADADREGDEDSDADEVHSHNTLGLVAHLLSWAIGVAFGRFDVRLATGTREIPTEPEPFDALHSDSPGMLSGNEKWRISEYPLNFPKSGVLVDDPGHAQDLTSSIRFVFDVVFGRDADRWWRDVTTLLDPKSYEIRTWLAETFFDHHLRRHSRTRRKAPIYWQLATASARYSVWLYAHRLTRDGFFQLQNDIVGPKLAHEERKLTSLIQDAGANPMPSQRKEIAEQESFVEDLRGMLDEVRRVAPLWNPNLDDGVVLTMAPLWRLVPPHKAWQKELKSKWDELADGKYDWSHIAMHLWPERVVPKCATDRSLAIAHDLEEVFWIENENGKWAPRGTPVRSIAELVRERTSPAIKASLKSLLEASSASQSANSRKRK